MQAATSLTGCIHRERSRHLPSAQHLPQVAPAAHAQAGPHTLKHISVVCWPLSGPDATTPCLAICQVHLAVTPALGCSLYKRMHRRRCACLHKLGSVPPSTAWSYALPRASVVIQVAHAAFHQPLSHAYMHVMNWSHGAPRWWAQVSPLSALLVQVQSQRATWQTWQHASAAAMWPMVRASFVIARVTLRCMLPAVCWTLLRP